jgi:hypothetical protein
MTSGEVNTLIPVLPVRWEIGVITPQQLLLLLVLEMGKAALIVPNAVMGAVAVVLVDTAGFLFIVNAYLLAFVKTWQEINVNSNDI